MEKIFITHTKYFKSGNGNTFIKLKKEKYFALDKYIL